MSTCTEERATHTHGPWEAHNCEVTTQQINGRSYRRIAAIQDYGVGSLKDIDEANAKLIAAAPELLAALQNILRVQSRDSIPFPLIALEKARAAIAKATNDE